MKQYPKNNRSPLPRWVCAPCRETPHADQFVSAIHGSPHAICSWQTFMDCKDGPEHLAQALAVCLPRRSLRKCEPYLRTMNSAAWAGIFMLVNSVAATRGGGRGRRDVLAPTSLWVESDCGRCLPEYVLRPSMAVMSKSGPHTYWLLVPGESLEDQKGALQALAVRYRTDPAVVAVHEGAGSGDRVVEETGEGGVVAGGLVRDRH